MLFETCEKAMPIHDLENMLTNIDNAFSEELLKLIDIKEKPDIEAYKKVKIYLNSGLHTST